MALAENANCSEKDFYSETQKKVLSLLCESKKKNSKTKLCLMVAPSFVVDFDYKNFVPLMRGLGFNVVTELTFGAKIVNENYHAFIKKNEEPNQGKPQDIQRVLHVNQKQAFDATQKARAFCCGTKWVAAKNGVLNPFCRNKNFQEKFISSVCPLSVNLIKTQYPKFTKFLLPFDSPMISMAKVLKKTYKNCKIVFVSPCVGKKIEAKEFNEKNKKDLIDSVITFVELKQILEKENPSLAGANTFDSFYNEYTKIYPLSGGLAKTLHSKNILKKQEIVSMDGCQNLQELLSKHSDKVFFDILFCKDGCIGGNGIASKMPTFWKKNKVLKYRKAAKNIKEGETRGIQKYSKGIKFDKKF